MKSTFIKLQNESLSKDVGQELLLTCLTCPIFFISLSQLRQIYEIVKLLPVTLNSPLENNLFEDDAKRKVEEVLIV